MENCRICKIKFDCADRKEHDDLCFNCYEENHTDVKKKRHKKASKRKEKSEKGIKHLYKIFCDGSCRGNPGRSGAGVVIEKSGTVIVTKSKYIGKRTCNEAEHLALIESLYVAKELEIKNITVRCDSLLVVNQINKKWKVHKEHLRVLADHCQELLQYFDFWKIKHIKREGNKLADKLAKHASS